MSQPLQERRYCIDFFQMTHVATPQVPTIEDGFESIINSGATDSLNVHGYIREIWQPIRRTSPLPNSYAGQFRKFRTSDLPEIGAAGQDSVALELAENHGLVERNFFVYYPDRQLLGWCRNAHGNTALQFAKFLAALWGTRVNAGPVLQPDAARRLIREEVVLKKIEVTLPRPTNPDFYAEEEFTQGLLDMLRRDGADSIHLTMGINTRRADTSGSLSSRLKSGLTEALGMGASTAKAVVYDEGIEHPIDLIADRIWSHQIIETNGRFPPSATMYQAIDAARDECRGSINDYFGSLEVAIT